jgi:hypothetical protein
MEQMLGYPHLFSYPRETTASVPYVRHERNRPVGVFFIEGLRYVVLVLFEEGLYVSYPLVESYF